MGDIMPKTIGASVFKKVWLQNKDFESIGKAVKKYLDEFAKIG